MRNLFKQIGLVLPVLLLSTLILVIPQLDFRDLMLPTQSGKTFGFIWGMLGYTVVVLFIVTINKEARIVRITWIDLLLGGYSLMVGGSYWLNPTDKLQMLSFGALILFYLSLRIIRKKHLKFILLAVVISGTFQAIYGNLQLWGYYSSNHGIFRLTGSFFNPGPYSGYLAAILSVSLSLYLFHIPSGIATQKLLVLQSYFSNKNFLLFFKKRFPKSHFSDKNSEVNSLQQQQQGTSGISDYITMKSVFLISIISICLVLPASRSRASWLAILGSAVYLISMRYQLTNQLKKFVDTKAKKAGLSILGFILLIISGFGLYHFKKDSADGRLLIWKVSTNMIKDKPLLGHGIGKFVAEYMNYQAAYFKANPDVSEAMQADNVSYAYNEFLKLIIEKGLIGFMLGLAVIWSLFIGKSEEGRRQELENPILLAARGGLLSILVFALFSYPSEILPIKILFVLFAAVVATHQNPIHVFQLPAKETALTSTAWYAALVLTLLTVYPANKYLTRQYQTYKSWKDASDIYNVGAYPECLDDFELAYPQLKTNGQFLLQYGKALEMAGKPEKSVAILNEAQAHLNNTILHTCLGDNYKALGRNTEAEQAYLHAWYMAPARFYPLYLLAKLYDDTDQTEKAVSMAKWVLNKEVKIDSRAIEEIKEEMQNIIEQAASLPYSYNSDGKKQEASSQKQGASCLTPSLNQSTFAKAMVDNGKEVVMKK